ncbi:uncharacterized protein isoform X2 [Choristoneura fumiferana]|uniref:uncharacterized protein isoform X2 n=1 Tax=Choristoneura fumiferana TaxID=7141 RepID=UPI003D15394E
MKRNLGNSLGFRAVKSCEDCTTKCVGRFKKVASLYGSGAAIYFYSQSGSEQCDKSLQTQGSTKNLDTFIVHNTSNTEISKNAIVKELSNYKTKCITCKGIIKRVRTLLEEIKTIRKNEIYAICDHCKRTSVKCKRCEYILGKYKESMTEEREQLFRQWLSKVKQLLETICQGNICRYRLCQESSDAAELDKLMMELNSPMLSQRQLEIGAFPPMEFQENLAQSKDMLQELIQKLKYESYTQRYSSDDNLLMPVADTGCICKLLMDRKMEQRKVLEPLTHQDAEPPKLIKAPSKTDLVEQKEAKFKEHRAVEKDKPKSSTTERSVREKSTKARKGSSTTVRSETEKSTKARKDSSSEMTSVTDKENKPAKEKKPKKVLHSAESELMKKLVAQRAKNKEKAEKPPKETKTKLPSFGELPKLRTLKRRELVEEFSDSILECDEEIIRSPSEMITGQKIVSFREHHELEKTESIQPLLFKVEADCPPSVVKQESLSITTQINRTAFRKKSAIEDRSGVIRYRLSDRQFIDKGWTQLPSTKIMRRMNVYKMLPVSNNWFTRNRYRGTLYYNSGEKLAVIEEDGQGKWLYKNGMVALQYYNAEEIFVQKRCVIYSYDACIKKTKSQTVLACFDYLGNGVVYDCQGNERLKYNQTEGHLIDKKIGPPGFWKWHSLNDPPVLHKAFIDTYSEDRTAVEPKTKVKVEDDQEITGDEANDAIDGALTLKLNLGMLLQSKEIIDSDCAELSCVGTPYDRRPARSASVQKLQGIVLAAKGKKQNCDHCFTPEDDTTAS